MPSTKKQTAPNSRKITSNLMKKLWLPLALALFSSCHLAAQKYSELKDIKYVTPSDGWVMELQLSSDSLFMDRKKGAEIADRKSYEILDEEKRGDNFIVYVKQQPEVIHLPSRMKSAPAPPDFGSISLFAFSFSKNKDRLFSLRDIRVYHSLQEIKEANVNARFDDKDFMTWYAEPVFKQYIRYPDVSTIGKDTLRQVVLDFYTEIKKRANNIRNSHNDGDMYKAGKMQNIVSTVLIEHHLNPMASPSNPTLNKEMADLARQGISPLH